MSTESLTRIGLWLAVGGLVVLMVMLQRGLMPGMLQLLFWGIVAAVLTIEIVVARRKAGADDRKGFVWRTELIVAVALGALLYAFAVFIFPGSR